jgi:hypothetical protein
VDDTVAVRNEEAGLRARAPEAAEHPHQRVELFRGANVFDEVNRTFRRRGWTDGLPVMAPTTGRVAELVEVSGRRANEIVGEMAPLGGLATVEAVAANAVMAGCGPRQFPYVLAAVDAVCDPAFNLAGVQTTDENVAPLVVVSAPAGALADADLHAGIGVLGPGWRGNATIGRALRLVMNNVGGGWPGAVSFAGAGHPGRYTLCAVEDDDACPWDPLRVELGYRADEALVVVTRAESVVNVTGGVPEIVSAMSSASSIFTALHGGVAALLLAPHTAAELAAAGRSRRDVAEDLATRARLPAEVWGASWVGEQVARDSPGRPRGSDVTVVRDADHLVVFVAGGRIPIPQHVWFPSWGFPAARVLRPVALGAKR